MCVGKRDASQNTNPYCTVSYYVGEAPPNTPTLKVYWLSGCK